MTASRLGLAILTALALGLGLVVALDRPPAAVPRSSRLLPGLDVETVTQLRLARDEGQVVLTRRHDGWFVEEPAAGPADPSAIADLLGALELASAERWVGGDAGRPRVQVTAVEHGGARWELAIGADGPAGLVFARGEAGAALVEAWVARALDRRIEDLRRRAVVAVAPPTGIELHAGGVDLVASGIPLRAHLPSGTIRLAPDRGRALTEALAALRFVRFPVEPPPTEVLGTLRVLGGVAPVEIDDVGRCPAAPEDRWLAGTSGSGCVSAAAWSAVVAAGRAIVDAPDQAVDPSPIGAAPVARLELLDDAVLEARGGGWTLTVAGVEQETDDAAVAELIAALRAPGRVVPSPPVKARTITVTDRDGTSIELARFDAALQRAGEPYAIEIAPALRTLLAGGWRSVADRVLLAEEPTLLRSIRSNGATVTMGSTFDDWTASAGTADLAAIAALRDLVASLEADELLPTAPVPPHRAITLGFDPPPAAGAEPMSVAITVGAPGRDRRCRARIGATTALLPAASCAILLAPLVR